ncbi:MAG: CBS domain-containing protein, partial [Bdellovibrionales bacterium]|nr:CBS domain-containing protein [Bdellovibrionales bacterium]
MAYTVKPAPCEVISSETSIHQTINIMKANQRKFVLIENNMGQLVGIFTISDLFKKLDMFDDRENWDKPISTIMEQPLKTLSVNFISKCAEFMVGNEVDVAPIVSQDKRTLLGVVSANSILKALVFNDKSPPIYSVNKSNVQTRNLAVLSPDGSFFSSMDRLFENVNHINIDRLYYGELMNDLKLKDVCVRYDALILDLDEAPKTEAFKLIKDFNQHPELETVVLVYNKSLHSENLNQLFASLKIHGRFLVYKKPIDFLNLMNDLESEWQKNSSK